jgi:hypothetical protein
VLHDLLILTLRVYVDRVRIPEESSIEPFVSLLALDLSINLIVIAILMPKKCNLTLRRLMSYIYGAPILDVSRSHTTTQHSR